MFITVSLAFSAKSQGRFVRIDGENLIQPDGARLYIVGTNLGNWLNPEGYMFGFSKTNSEWMIDNMLCQMIGTDATAEFWKKFKDSYITEDDIKYIASTGANTIRLPFNYKLFTDEDYMGLTCRGDGFERIDNVVKWCRDNHLYLILDMHDCPNGQTGDNIDDGFGYPWLFESEVSQQLFCDIWQKIAKHYSDETTVLGYELMNEPIATYFDNKAELNSKLQPLYKRVVKAIRRVDKNHILLLGGAQWNGNFDMFNDWNFDNKIMYTCHRYGGEASKAAIQSLIDFRNRTGLPMYMGEIGHNTDKWQSDFCKVMRENNIGYTFWPYKKLDGSCMMAIKRPIDWEGVVVKYSEIDRNTYKAWREARPDQQKVKAILNEYIENCKTKNCVPQSGYIESMGLKP